MVVTVSFDPFLILLLALGSLIAWNGLHRAVVVRQSVLMGFFVVALVHGEEVLELPLEGLEGGSTHWIFVPTLEHDLVECWIAVGRHWHTVAVLNLTEDFGVGHT